MHNDLCAFSELLNPIVGLTHIGAQVVLADIVDGQDAGEFCVGLLGTPLRYPLSPLCLPHPGEAQGQQAGRDRPNPAKVHTPAQIQGALDDLSVDENEVLKSPLPLLICSVWCVI